MRRHDGSKVLPGIFGTQRHWGQAAVEFTISALVLMMLMFGVLDLGRGVLQRQDLTNATREGARYAALNSAARAQSASDFAATVASTAAQRAPSLQLAATNFQVAGGGGIVCESATSATLPGQPGSGFGLPAQWAGNGLLALGRLVVAKQPTSTPVPTPLPGASPVPTPSASGSVSWSTVACSAAQPADRLTVCARYDFRPVADKLFHIGTVQMTECSWVTIQ